MLIAPPAARDLVLPVSERPLLMAVLNVTPDSFYDGGRYLERDAAEAHGRTLAAEGADILDIGGESTRPGASPVPAEDEMARTVPLVRALSAATDIPISIDTFKAVTARAALAAGARIVNDVWGFQHDPDMASVAADAGAISIIMHNRSHESAPVADICAEMRAFFDRSLEIAERAGLPRERIVLDPGIGFGKTSAQNVWLAARPGWLKAEYGLPVLVGASRKRLIGHLIGDSAADRLAGTLALHTMAAANGADIIRAHDARAHRDALKVVAAIRSMDEPLSAVQRRST